MSGAARRPRWLFVAYGGGHVRMLLPVAELARERGLADVEFIGLTTARAPIEQAGFRCLGYRDFTGPADAQALAQGQALAAQLGPGAVDAQESAAYLGLNYRELQMRDGVAGAAALYARYGRQAFAPLQTMRAFVQRLAPDLVVATSAPRSERAALEAAGALGLPSACLVDLFAGDEIAWTGQLGFADRVCVLNEAVRQRFVQAGRAPGDVVVTGNPAFDSCAAPVARQAGEALRRQRGWPPGRTILFASAPEPREHPFRPGVLGDEQLPARTWQALQALARSQPLCRLVLRLHPSEATSPPAWAEGAELAGQDIALDAVINAVDLVVVLVSTVAVQAHLAGCRVLQVGGALFEDAAPFVEYGLADERVEVGALGDAAWRWLSAPPAAPVQSAGGAAQAVVAQLQSLAAPTA